MNYVHVKNLEKFHPGYRDRNLLWGKVYTSVVSGDPDWDLIENEVDKWRLIGIILLELRAKKPLPNDDRYWAKYFHLKKRSMSLTLQMLHNFLDVVTQNGVGCVLEKRREDKIREDIDTQHTLRNKKRHFDFVLLTDQEFEKLTADLGAGLRDEYIQKLNDYLGSTGRRYKSHYHTILTWWRKEGGKKPSAEVLKMEEMLNAAKTKR